MSSAYMLMKARGFYNYDTWVNEELNVEVYLDKELALAEAKRLNEERDEFGTPTEREELYKRYKQWMDAFFREFNSRQCRAREHGQQSIPADPTEIEIIARED